MSKNYNKDHFITHWSDQGVNFDKVSSDIKSSVSGNIYDKMNNAWAERTTMKGADTLLTRFDESVIKARYFSDKISGTSTVYTLYKKKPNDNFYTYVCTVRNGVYSVNDYNVLSDHYYHYMVTVENQNINELTGEPYIDYTIYEHVDSSGRNNYYAPHLSGWMICDIELSEEDGIYIKTGNSWFLGYNLSGEKISKNMNINSQDTLGRYPKITKGTSNYDSMSFSSLLGQICEYYDYSFNGEGNEEEKAEKHLTNYPTLVYNYTEKESVPSKDHMIGGVTKKYATEMDKLESWKQFVNDGELKLIRDMKGNAWIAQITGDVSYEIQNESNLKQTMIGFSWKEVKDLSDISIIRENDN